MKVILTSTGPDLARALAVALGRRAARAALDDGGFAAGQDTRLAAHGPAANAEKTVEANQTEDRHGKSGQ